jgi:hypothetical protein
MDLTIFLARFDVFGRPIYLSWHVFTNVAWNMVLSGNSSFNDTISFKENIKGWVSFKSFLPENALSMGNDYYTFKNGNLWRHHEEDPTFDRNTFYDPIDWVNGDNYTSSSVEVVLNDSPSSIKDFHTLNYEGSQSKVQKFINAVDGTLSLPYQPTTTYTDQSYHNLSDKLGWHVDNVYTDKEEGYISEFLEKEGKWYNNINRTIDTTLDKADTSDFTFQGIGTVQTAGCTNPAATNYNPNATVDDGSCILQVVDPVLDDVVIAGCTDVDAVNYNPLATTDDGSCSYLADDSSSDDSDSGSDSSSDNDEDNGTDVFGCTDELAMNYDPNATINDGSCNYLMDPEVPDNDDKDDVVLEKPDLSSTEEGVKTTKTKAATKPATTETPLAKEVATPTRIPTRRRGY